MSESDGFHARFEIFRGDEDGGEMVHYDVDLDPGMVVLDAIHEIQAQHAPDLAVRWNCKAGKCGSCSAEVNGQPVLTCMTRVEEVFDPEDGDPVEVRPMKTFPIVKDLVTDVSWNYEVNKTIDRFQPGEMTEEEREKGEFKMSQEDVDRLQEFRKCIECYLCQDTCHVLREHNKDFMGPRFLIRAAGLEMHPKDEGDRLSYLKDEGKIGYCNITKCCTEVCPENIEITDNGIIPMKERVAGAFYDPVKVGWRKLTGKPGPAPHEGGEVRAPRSAPPSAVEVRGEGTESTPVEGDLGTVQLPDDE